MKNLITAKFLYSQDRKSQRTSTIVEREMWETTLQGTINIHLQMMVTHFSFFKIKKYYCYSIYFWQHLCIFILLY